MPMIMAKDPNFVETIQIGIPAQQSMIIGSIDDDEEEEIDGVVAIDQEVGDDSSSRANEKRPESRDDGARAYMSPEATPAPRTPSPSSPLSTQQSIQLLSNSLIW